MKVAMSGGVVFVPENQKCVLDKKNLSLSLWGSSFVYALAYTFTYISSDWGLVCLVGENKDLKVLKIFIRDEYVSENGGKEVYNLNERLGAKEWAGLEKYG